MDEFRHGIHTVELESYVIRVSGWITRQGEVSSAAISYFTTKIQW